MVQPLDVVEPLESQAATITLRDRINRLAYVVANVTDYERSLEFYESVTPLRRVAEFEAPEQEFAGLGIKKDSFRAAALTDGLGLGAPELHLVEWAGRDVTERAYPSFWHVGIVKVAFVMPSVKEQIARLAAYDLRPTQQFIYRNYVGAVDPDGITLAFPSLSIDRPENPPAPRWVHVNPSVSDIHRSMEFYGGFLGLDLASQHRPSEPAPSSTGPGSDMAQWDSHLYTPRGDARVHVDISQFHYPKPTADSMIPYDSARHIGLARIGFEVDDIDLSFAILQRAEAAGFGLELMGGIEVWDLGSRGRRRVVCFKDPDGCRLELIEKIKVLPTTDKKPTPKTEPYKAW